MRTTIAAVALLAVVLALATPVAAAEGGANPNQRTIQVSGTGETQTATLHRIDEDFLIKDVEKAGFKLYGASSALRNPKDDRTWLVFKHRGETDRFMLKFVKAPAVATGASGSGSGQ